MIFHFHYFQAEVKLEYLLNLSILISKGKEINWDCLSNGEWSVLNLLLTCIVAFGVTIVWYLFVWVPLIRALTIEGASPIITNSFVPYIVHLSSSVVWDCYANVGRKLVPKLNIITRPIANKYREGKLKSTLKRELNST
jgi:hypothetical protein